MNNHLDVIVRFINNGWIWISSYNSKRMINQVAADTLQIIDTINADSSQIILWPHARS